jgi:hypothetical protein
MENANLFWGGGGAPNASYLANRDRRAPERATFNRPCQVSDYEQLVHI